MWLLELAVRALFEAVRDELWIQSRETRYEDDSGDDRRGVP